MADTPDLEADLSGMNIEELLDHQQALTRLRLTINDRARRTQELIDQRAEEVRQRRAEEDARFGQVTKPPTQEIFGSTAPPQ